MAELRGLRGWYERAGVRTAPRREFGPEPGDIDKDFFPEELVPHLPHPLVQEAGPGVRRYLVAQHLYQWLQFTTHFEVSVVNRATRRIADGTAGLDLPVASRMDAYKIYVDEGYHSLYSLDACQQLEARSGIAALPYDFGPFLRHLDAVGSDFPEHRRLIQLLQVVVFETLITSILSDIPDDERVVGLVRDVVRDHAADERRHHAFFTGFFKMLWGQLDPPTRRLVAPFLPALIVRSLQPATRPARDALRQLGFTDGAADTIVRETFTPEVVSAGIRVASARTVVLFQHLGIVDMPGVREEFVRERLLDG